MQNAAKKERGMWRWEGRELDGFWVRPGEWGLGGSGGPALSIS